MSRPIAADKKEKIIKLAVKDGISTSAIAERLGCRTATVTSALREAGCTWCKKDRTWSAPQEESDDQLG